jgi:hypothetical protein
MKTAAFAAAWMALSPAEALAYIDPGAGSVALQLLLAGAAGFGLIVKLLWRRILSALGLGRKDAAGGSGEPQRP